MGRGTAVEPAKLSCLSRRSRAHANWGLTGLLVSCAILACSDPSADPGPDGPADTVGVDARDATGDTAPEAELPEDASADRSIWISAEAAQDAPASEPWVCTEAPIWTVASLGFTYVSAGGRVVEDGCPPERQRYQFQTVNRTLISRGCDEGVWRNYLVHLTEAQVEAIVDLMRSIREACSTPCIFDRPIVSVTVSASGVQQTYTAMSCRGPRPLIGDDDADALRALLASTVDSACNPDAADTSIGDSGTVPSCVPLPNDGGLAR
jgi:hypothetical protein